MTITTEEISRAKQRSRRRSSFSAAFGIRDGASNSSPTASAMTPKAGTKTALAPNMLDLNSLARFVDPLPIPPVAKSLGRRPSPANPAVQVPYYRLAMRPSQARSIATCSQRGSGRWAIRSRARRWKPARANPFWLSGSTSCRIRISCRLTTPFTAPKAISPTCGRWFICMARRFRRRATAIRRTGSCPENPPRPTTRTARTPRCSGITTTRWGSTA